MSPNASSTASSGSRRGHQPVEGEPPAAVEVEQRREVALRARGSVDGAEHAPLHPWDRKRGQRHLRVGRRDPDQHRGPSRARGQERRAGGLGASGRLDRVVDPAATGRADRFGGLVRAARPLDRVGRAEAQRRLELLRCDVDGHDRVCAHGDGGEDGAQPDAAAAEDRDAVARPHVRRRQTAPVPVVIAQPTSAATSNGTSSGIAMQHRAGTTARSANVDRKQ